MKGFDRLPMEEGDYLLDEAVPHSDAMRLLLDDARSPQEIGMRAIASAIHQWGPILSAADLDQAARWAKVWAVAKRPRKRPGDGSLRAGFWKELQKLSEDPHLVKMTKSAARRTGLSITIATLAGFCFTATAFLYFIDAGSTWWGSALAVSLAALVSSFLVGARATETMGQRERRYVISAIRSAESLGELNDAGLFDYSPESEYSEHRKYDPQRVQHAAAAVISGLSDALYRDWQGIAGVVEWHVPQSDLNERLGIVRPPKKK